MSSRYPWIKVSPARTPPGICVGQLFHFISGVILFAFVWAAWIFCKEPFPMFFWIAAAFPAAHQIFVWLAWRLELYSSVISKTIGFRWYLILFFLLFGGRFISLLVLAWMDHGSLKLPLLPQSILTTIFSLIGIYAMYSVKRYFGMIRAAGADHFDPQYRSMPLVKEGIFRFSSNGMYTYAFLLFWAISLGFNSAAALIISAFSHAYIWVHFYATEKPDMDFLYTSS